MRFIWFGRARSVAISSIARDCDPVSANGSPSVIRALRLREPSSAIPERRAPRLEVVPTAYGAFYSAARRLAERDEWHRINQFIFPFHTMISAASPFEVNLRSFVPLDDHYAMLISQHGYTNRPIPVRPRLLRAIGRMLGMRSNAFDQVGGYLERSSDPRSYFMTRANRRNDYMRNREVEKELMFNGIPFVLNLQDRAMTELMTNDRGEPIWHTRSTVPMSMPNSSDAVATTARSSPRFSRCSASRRNRRDRLP